MKKLLLTVVLIISFIPFIHAQTNYALNFDGTNDYVSVPHDASFNFTAFTIELWVNASALSNKVVGKTDASGATNGYVIGLESNGTIFGEVFGGWSSTERASGTSANNSITLNTWHHIALSWTTGGDLIGYINGAEQFRTSTSGKTISFSNTNSFILGEAPWTNSPQGFFTGQMDEVRIWNVVRSQADIQANINKELVGNESGLIAYYKMSDGSGMSLSDNSGNSHTGTLINGTTWVTSAAPVPVELASFTASINNNTVALRWNTSTEINNYGFEIERRIANSEQLTVNSWKKIGFIAGNGTSNAPKEYSYSDATTSSGSYVYRLKQVDNDGTFKYSQSVEVSLMTPAEFGLDQNYPNPFNPSTVISYQLPVTGNVTLKIYNVLGKEVATLVNETKDAGNYTALFNASQLSSGLYFFKLTTNEFSSVRKMTLMK